MRSLFAKFYQLRYAVFTLVLAGCAGFDRNCANSKAERFGADWIIVTTGASGQIVNCWKLTGVSVTNERNSDGVYWKSPAGHLVHVSGWYSRVQVSGGDYAAAAAEIGADLARCPGGRYLDAPAPDSAPVAGPKVESAGRAVSAVFGGNHTVRAVLAPGGGARELWVDGKPVSVSSTLGRAALQAIGVE